MFHCNYFTYKKSVFKCFRSVFFFPLVSVQQGICYMGQENPMSLDEHGTPPFTLLQETSQGMKSNR